MDINITNLYNYINSDFLNILCHILCKTYRSYVTVLINHNFLDEGNCHIRIMYPSFDAFMDPSFDNR